jgi:hypothetical protein
MAILIKGMFNLWIFEVPHFQTNPTKRKIIAVCDALSRKLRHRHPIPPLTEWV